VYDVTNEQRYLKAAQSIFNDMDKAYNTTPCGGLWWDKQHTYVNAIANELYIDVAAHLATRSQHRSSYYLDRAIKACEWFQNSGMINAQWNINDGLNSTTCENNNGTVWSYNQGVILGALSELSRATRDTSFTTLAKRIADAGIAKLSDSDGILHDPCEPDCGADGSQFKGVFARNLRILQQVSPEARYAKFLGRNADSVWHADRNRRNKFGLVWDGPFVGPANASTQSSALDVIVAALST
jgi:predicted alpha-1,6-mannanase (GH76 family)